MNWLKNLLVKHPIGLRVLKTGIAVTVCVAVTFLLKLNQPFFAVVATVMSMGKSIDISFKAGKNKLVGVLIGVVVGYAFSLLSPANAGLCGIGIILTLYLCQLLKLSGAATLSCFLFSAMMFSGSLTGHLATWQFALTCTIDSFIGIAIALIVNLLIMPPNYAEEIKKASERLHVLIQTEINSAAALGAIDLHAAQEEIRKLNSNLGLYVAEVKFLRWNDDEVFQTSNKVTIYQSVLDELKAVQVMSLSGNGAEPVSLTPEQETVYRYHLNRMQTLFGGTKEPPAEKR